MKKKWKVQDWSMKWKAAIILLILGLLPIASISALFFYQSNNILQQQVIDTSYRNLNVASSNFEKIIQDIEDMSEYIIYSDEFYEFMTLSPGDVTQGEINGLDNSLQAFFTFHLSNKSYFNSVKIEGRNGLVINKGDIVLNSEEKWANESKKRQGSVLWTDPYHIESDYPVKQTEVISLFRVINNKHNAIEPIGEVRIRLKEEELFHQMMYEDPHADHEVFILRENGLILSHEDKDMVGEPFPDDTFVSIIQQSSDPAFQYILNDETYYIAADKVDDFYLVSMVKERFILNELSEIRKTTQNIIIATVILSLIAIVGFIFTILKPIIELTRETKRVESGDFSARVKVRSQDEIGLLGARFNKMVTQVQHLIETKYKLEIQNKESELRALQSHVNPHFLYNMLDMIRWSARLENAPETGKSIEDLSRIFRTSLSSGKIWVNLEEEIKNVKSYLELQKRRLGVALSFYIVTEVGIEKARVMKLILQPLVENSIKHGFIRRSSENRIYIRVYRSEANIIIDVFDNGKGMKYWRKTFSSTSANQQSGFALNNINDRIAHAFGKQYGLSLMDHPKKQGTWIRLQFPYTEDENVSE
ncbi:sensor histidine kinase [Salipaludibacillus sp. HK11]|uniref:sensor histidine kinase n=1 Tax=Salipaludibacillus sp. HK11 TaxID=3394320 RepID=UPI0039FCF709